MPEPVLIRYQASGVPEVHAAFDSIEQRIVRLTAAANRGQGTRVAGARAEVSAQEAEYAKLAKWAERMQSEQTKAAAREARAREVLADREASSAGKEAQQAARAEVKAAQEATKALEREMRARDSIRDRSAAMAGRYAEREANDEIKAAERAAHATANARKRIGTTVGGAVLSGTGRVLGGMARFGGMAIGAMGAFGVADAVRGHFAAERVASKIVNQATIGGVPAEGANRENIMNHAAALAVKTGMDKADILEATSSYMANARSSDFKGAMGNMEFFGKMSKVTGADSKMIAAGAGKLQSQNKDLGPAEMQSLLLHADAMSKQGTMSFEQAIEGFGKVGSTRTSYRGDTGRNQAQLLGLAQIAGAGGNAEEVGTFISAIAGETHQANKKWKKAHGHNLVQMDSAGQMGSPEEVIEQVLRGTGGNIDTIKDLYGRRGGVLFGEVAGSFQAASKAAGGGKAGVEAGIAAVKENIHSVMGAAETPADLEKEFAQTMSSSAEKFSKAVEVIREKVEGKVAVHLDKLSDKLGDPAFMANIGRVIDALGWLASFLLDNPIKGVGAVVLASVTKDLASAAIGEAVKAAMVRAAGGGGSALPPGAGPVAGGLAGIAIAGAATASAFGEKAEEQASAKGDVGGLLGGTKGLTPEQMQKRAAQLRRAIGEGRGYSDTAADAASDFLLPASKVANALGSVFGQSDVTGEEARSAAREHAKVVARNLPELEEALKKLTKAIDAGATSTTSPSDPARHGPLDARSGASPR